MRTIALFLLLYFPALSLADTIHIPGDYSTIQAGIDAAVNGDTILVAPGTYVENIDFLGRAIKVRSSEGAEATVIDGGNPVDPAHGSVVTFANGEPMGSVLSGFTITNGVGSDLYSGKTGGGIFCLDSSPVIKDNIITGNNLYLNGRGGGISCHNSYAKISNNIISDNLVDDAGGGIYCSAWPTTPFGTNIISNVISNNTAGRKGGGICSLSNNNHITCNTITGNQADNNGSGISCGGGYDDFPTISDNLIKGNEGSEAISCWGCWPYIINNVIVENDGRGIITGSNRTEIVNNTIIGNSGPGLYCGASTLTTVTNTIFRDNDGVDGYEIYLSAAYSPYPDLTIHHSNVKGGIDSVLAENGCGFNWGAGMIEGDPMFVNAAQGDYHLQYDSTCRDAGDNASIVPLASYDYEDDPRIAWDGIVDIGADEFFNHLYCTGDFTPSGSIEGKFVGLPATWPVGLFIGSGVLDPPMQHGWGEFYLESPWLLFPLVPIPANGFLAIPATVPSTPGPYDIPMQALIGWELSNLFVLEVR